MTNGRGGDDDVHASLRRRAKGIPMSGRNFLQPQFKDDPENIFSKKDLGDKYTKRKKDFKKEKRQSFKVQIS